MWKEDPPVSELLAENEFAEKEEDAGQKPRVGT